jgi:multidrug efflux pump subunit AcrB
MLIGMAAKNAILIVKLARERGTPCLRRRWKARACGCARSS